MKPKTKIFTISRFSEIKIFIFLLFLNLFLFSYSYSYSELDGKYIEIRGPFCWENLGVAKDEEMCDLLIKAIEKNDKERFNYLLESFRVLRIKKNTKAVVLELKIEEKKAKILILTGIYKYSCGWIPIQWLYNPSLN